MKVLLKYKQREPKPTKIVDLFGVKTYVSQNGFIDYDQEETIEANKIDGRVKELKSFSNRIYHSFTVVNLEN
jgi:hypothetical protein